MHPMIREFTKWEDNALNRKAMHPMMRECTHWDGHTPNENPMHQTVKQKCLTGKIGHDEYNPMGIIPIGKMYKPRERILTQGINNIE